MPCDLQNGRVLSKPHGYRGTMRFVALGILVPVALTPGILAIGGGDPREYVFVFSACIALLGIVAGLWPALLGAVVSFVLADYYFVPPVRTFTLLDRFDTVNLAVLLGTAVVVGGLADRRRRAQSRAEELSERLSGATTELLHLNQKERSAAEVRLRLARTEEQLRAMEESERFRAELLANVSHELRTPITTILTASTAALDASRPEAAMRALSAVADEAQRLEALVADLLDMTRIEGGALHLRIEPIRLADALAAAIERLQALSPNREVIWPSAASEAFMVQADWRRLGQILDNIFDNADRFATVGAPIRVTVDDGRETAATIYVQNDGPGIPPELGAKVFDRFVRGPSDAARRPGGLGLGLAIVRGLIAAQGGEVGLASDGGSAGTTFWFTLPMTGSDQPMGGVGQRR